MSDAEIEQFQEQWKNYYIAKGLPETLLDAMTTEANAEYGVEIGVDNYNRYAKLTVNIINDSLVANEYYTIAISRGAEIFRGIATNKNTVLFADIPTNTLTVEVFKMTNTPILKPILFGKHIFTMTKDSEISITPYIIMPEQMQVFTTNKRHKINLIAALFKRIPQSAQTLSASWEVTVE